MKTIALRFADNFAPSDGTIAEHQKMIAEYGFVWYGKLGASISQSVRKSVLDNELPRILLIHSGKSERYWAYVDDIRTDTPELDHIPRYYREQTKSFKTWFKVTRIDSAPNNIIGKCMVVSSRRPLSEVSRSSMNPYFIIDVEE